MAPSHNTTYDCLKKSIFKTFLARKAEGRGKAGPQFSPGGCIVLWPLLTQKAPPAPGESNEIVFPKIQLFRCELQFLDNSYCGIAATGKRKELLNREPWHQQCAPPTSLSKEEKSSVSIVINHKEACEG